MSFRVVFGEVTRCYADVHGSRPGLYLGSCSDFDTVLEAVHDGLESVMADGPFSSLGGERGVTKR